MSNTLRSIIYWHPRPKTARQMQSMARKMLIDMLDPDEPIVRRKDWDGDIDFAWKVFEFLGYATPVEEDDDDDSELESNAGI